MTRPSSEKPPIAKRRKSPARAAAQASVKARPENPGMRDEEMERLVQPDGLAVRRRRHDHGWSSRELATAITNASFESSGLRQTLTPNQIQGIEERAERISYGALLLLAGGLDCDPVDLLANNDRRALRPDSLLN